MNTIKQPGFIRILFYIIIKYLVFFIVLAFMGNRFNDLVLVRSGTGEQILVNSMYYLIEVLFAILIFTLILLYPYHLLFKISKIALLLAALLALNVIEYFLYEATCDMYIHFNWNGVISFGISIAFFFIIFRGCLGWKRKVEG